MLITSTTGNGSMELPLLLPGLIAAPAPPTSSVKAAATATLLSSEALKDSVAHMGMNTQNGVISVPTSEAGESEIADDDDFVFSTDDEEEIGAPLRSVTQTIEGLKVVEESEEQEERKEEEEEEQVEDPHTRHARAVIAARALYAGIYSLSSFSSPCISRQELVDDQSGMAAYLGFEPMKLILNSAATPKACKSPTTTRSPSSTVRLVSAFTPVVPTLATASSSSSANKKIVTPCSTPTLTHPVAYTLAPARSGFLKLQ